MASGQYIYVIDTYNTGTGQVSGRTIDDVNKSLVSYGYGITADDDRKDEPANCIGPVNTGLYCDRFYDDDV